MLVKGAGRQLEVARNQGLRLLRSVLHRQFKKKLKAQITQSLITDDAQSNNYYWREWAKCV
jgi:hypothetical protein